jgi:hypothetical protein
VEPRFCEKFKGNNSIVPEWILLVIELGLHFVIMNIVSKFGEDRMKTHQVGEQKPKGCTDGRTDGWMDGQIGDYKLSLRGA